jgi:hypothetical protein
VATSAIIIIIINKQQSNLSSLSFALHSHQPSKHTHTHTTHCTMDLKALCASMHSHLATLFKLVCINLAIVWSGLVWSGLTIVRRYQEARR